jgi:hypothetical protein
MIMAGWAEAVIPIFWFALNLTYPPPKPTDGKSFPADSDVRQNLTKGRIFYGNYYFTGSGEF